MRRGGTFLLTALVFLFFAEGQRAFFASLFILARDAVAPAFDPGAAILALIPLLFLLAPLLPLARLVDRAGAVTVAAAGVAVFRLPMAHPALATRAVGSALVLACFGLFLAGAVGWLDRRALSAGAVAGLVADQLLRLAGTGYDLALQPAWVPVQAVLSLALLALAVAWARRGDGREEGAAGGNGNGDDGGLERRAGGLRLRGALALGPLLFLDLHLLGLPPVAARWTGIPWEAAAAAAAVTAGVALALALAGYGPTRARRTVVALVAAVALALAAGWWGDGALAGGAMAVGHGAALLLIARTLDPASGRRGRGVVIAVLGLLTAFTALFTLTFFVAAPLAFLDPGAPWVLAAALALLAGSAVLLPAAAATPPALGPAGGALAAGAVAATAALLLLMVTPRAGAHEDARATTTLGTPGALDTTDPGSPAPAATLTVAAGSARLGFDGARRFDPHGLADAITAAAPAAVVLGDVPAGVPAACGVDLALWLQRRLGARGQLIPSANGLLGRAVLIGPRREEAAEPAAAAAPTAVGGVAIHAVPLLRGPGAGEAREAWLRAIPSGPAAVVGVPVRGGAPALDDGLRDRLRAAGFAGADPETAQRAASPMDWIRVRELWVVAMEGVPEAGRGFGLATASLAVPQTPAQPVRR